MENAHFVWTQLKVYDAYKTQRSVVPPCALEEKESVLLTNTENSEKKEEANPEKKEEANPEKKEEANPE